MGVRLQVLGVLLVGLLASGGAGLLMHRVEQDGVREALDNRVAAARESVATAAQRYVDALQLSAGSLEALPRLDAGSFATATAALGQLWLPGASSIDFIVPVAASDVAAAQADWRSRAGDGLTFAPASGVPRHAFTVLERVLDQSAALLGEDLAGSAEAAAAIERAARVGLPAMSEPYVLSRDAELPPGRRQQAVLLAQRVVDPVTGALRGYVGISVRMQDFFADTMAQPALLDVELAAMNGAEPVPVARIERRAGDLRRSVPVQAADQQWQLRVATNRAALIGPGGHLDAGLFFAGLALTAVTAALVLTLARGRRPASSTADADLESLSYGVSHDLRAPLRAVDGFARMLALDYGGVLDERGRGYVGRIRAGVEQMGELIDGLLAFSGLYGQELASRRVPIDRLVAHVWDELAVDRGDRDVTLAVGELPDALGDPRLIRQVLSNLLGNAVKFTRDVSPARVEVGHRVTAGGQATYFVGDNGTGFDMRYADKLFKVFQRLHGAEEQGGTGMGLAIAQRIVHRHGGQIWADAAPGKGAVFYFTLPAAPPLSLDVVPGLDRTAGH